MKILVLDYLIKQTQKKQMSPSVVSKVYKEIEQLEKLRSLGKSSLDAYIKNQNGKKMQGTEKVWKYRLTDGDRILYTYGEYLDYIRVNDKDSLVIIAYAKHDDQGDIKLPPKQEYYFGDEVIRTFNDLGITAQDLKDMSMEDISAFEEIFSAEFLRLHSLYVVSVQEFEDRDPNSIDVCLSDEQDNYINAYIEEQNPLLIIGGAGTGKTVMATHILSDYKIRNEEKKCVYFTQSSELLEKIKKKYRYISHNDLLALGRNEVDEDTEFFNINDYCRQRLGLLERNLVKTDQFLEYVNTNSHIMSMLAKAGIAPIDLWAEIRGTIKGGLDENWRRVMPKDRTQYKKEVIDELDKKGLILWEKNRKFFTIQNKCAKSSELSVSAKKVYDDLAIYFDSVDCSIPMIKKERYLSLSPELSTLNPEHRELAYDICQEYQVWLGVDRFDENDLVLRMLSNLDLLQSFDMVIVDEIQDYTELQIYLLHRLVKDDRYFIMAGDVHQNVNPTIFSSRRIHPLVGNRLVVNQLEKNFRCQKKIVEYANALGDIRNKYVAKDKGSRFEFSERDGETPCVLRYTDNNEEKLLLSLANYPNTAILVPNESVKSLLIDKISVMVDDAPDFIFTVSEIKGMEYRYVVCYDLIGYYNDIWQQILNDKVARKETRYRYYFNLFYVGITRAEKFLCFMEKENCGIFWNLLESKAGTSLVQVTEFDEVKLHIADLSNSIEAMMEQALKYEDSGKYEQAIQWYEKANASETVIDKCKIKLYISNRNYTKAVSTAIKIDDKESARKILPEIADNQSLTELVKIWLDISIFNKRERYTGDAISKLIRYAIEPEDQGYIVKRFIEVFDLNYENVMNNIMKR